MNGAVLNAFLNFRPRPRDAWMIENEAIREQIARQIALFPAWALPTSAAPTCIAGVVYAFGAAQAWMLTGIGFERDARRILPVMQWGIRHFYERLGLRRLEMQIEVDDSPAERWARHTGFRFEAGPLKRKGARGEDMNIWLYQPREG